MAIAVQKVPQLPLATRSTNPQDIVDFQANLIKQLYPILVSYAQRLNLALIKDGTEPMTAPLMVSNSTVVELTNFPPVTWKRGIIYVDDESGGPTLAFSDGTNWRRVQDRAIVS